MLPLTGWLHSGDIGYYNECGEIFIVDRIKEVMKFRGHHVSPNEIEELLLNHPGVLEVAVVPVPHLLDIERPMAFVKKIPGHNVIKLFVFNKKYFCFLIRIFYYR